MPRISTSKNVRSFCLRVSRSSAPVVLILLGLAWFSLCVGLVAVQAVSLGTLNTPPPAPPAEVSYKKGVASLSTGDLQEAEEAFKLSQRQDARYTLALVGLADVALRKKDLKAAEGYLRQAVARTPDDGTILMAWGRFLHSQRRFKEAEEAFKQAAARTPQSSIPLISLGRLYLSGLHQPQEAVQIYRRVAERQPYDANVRQALGQSLAATGQLEAATAELIEAGRLAPDNPTSFYELGRVYLARRDRDRALEAFDAALRVTPSFPPAHIAKGEIFERDQHDERALTEYEAALKGAPRSALVHLKIGQIHERHRRMPEAEQAYLKAIDTNPKLAIAYNNLAMLLVERNERLDQALEWARTSIKLSPNVPVFLDTVGWVYRARGDHQQALAALRKASGMKPAYPGILYHLGILYAERGQRKDAVKAFSEALSLKQDFPQAADTQARLNALQRAS